jgi:multidrug efflux pump subunit AcrB
MFEKIIKFFIDNYKINYALLLAVFFAGFYSYSQIPKEVTPDIEPSSIRISGSYSGASVDMLNNMVVTPLEDQVQNIVGVEAVLSTVQPGKFSIVLELSKYENKNEIKENVKDAIGMISDDLPSDMNDPLIKSVAHARSLMFVTVLSTTKTHDELIEIAKEVKSKILSIPFVSDITIFGESDEFYEITLDEKKMAAYGLNKNEVLNVIKELSYTFPLGKIEDKNNRFYLSTQNGKKEVSELENTLLKVNGQYIYFKEFATISKRYEDSSTLASMNAKDAVTLAISQNSNGDAITISKDVRNLLQSLKTDDLDFDVKRDYSDNVKESLNVVFSNIIFAIILIGILTVFLINIKLALVIVIGIPTSFVMGAIYFYFTGHSINVNSLIGVLLAVGIIVDDAIVVSENIQQYIEKGYPPKKAAFLGTKEMVKPVTIASLTTIFSFIPLLMISGRMGEIIELIPIAFCVLVLASLIESFIFLPLHSAHLLSANTKTLSWEKIKKIYVKTLRFFTSYQKTFLVVFISFVTIATFFSIKHSKFQLFNRYDSGTINISLAANKNNTLEQTSHIIKQIESDFLQEKDNFFIQNVSSTSGHRRTATGETQMYPYVGNLNIELQKLAPTNFFDKYITPLLSVYYEKEGRTRTSSSQQVSKRIRQWLESKNYKEKYDLSELMVVQPRMGAVKADIRIGVVANEYKKALKAIQSIENELKRIKGIENLGNNVKLGIDELKFKVNAYGESLGLTEQKVGAFVASVYTKKDLGTIYDNGKSLEIKTKSLYEDDYSFFENLTIPLDDAKKVRLLEVCEIEKIQSLQKLEKDNGVSTFYLFANVDTDVITASEVTQVLKPVLSTIEKSGIEILLKGEAEQKKVLQLQMTLSIVLALGLIFLSLLYLFNSVRETLTVMSVIPFSMLGLYIGHFLLDNNITLPSLIGAVGLAGVLVNDGILMMSAIKAAKDEDAFYEKAASRFRPVMLTSITTIVGLFSLIFFATDIAVSFQPMAITLGFGLLWGTVVNLLYLPTVYRFLYQKRFL